MTNHDHQLTRLLAGELEPAAVQALETELAQSPELRARLEQMRQVWNSEPDNVPELPSVRDSVLAKARASRDGELSWRLAPTWARTGAAAALIVGLTAGIGLGRQAPVNVTTDLAVNTSVTQDVVFDLDESVLSSYTVPSLADGYWEILEEDDDSVGESS